MPYVYTHVDQLKDKPWVDGGNCVSLIKHYAPGLKNISTLEWRAGERIMDAKDIARGTAIATFENGRYPRRGIGQGNHAAFYLWRIHDGIYVMDQFARGNRKGPYIGIRLISRSGKNPDGSYINPSNNADAFYVIER